MDAMRASVSRLCATDHNRDRQVPRTDNNMCTTAATSASAVVWRTCRPTVSLRIDVKYVLGGVPLDGTCALVGDATVDGHVHVRLLQAREHGRVRFAHGHAHVPRDVIFFPSTSPADVRRVIQVDAVLQELQALPPVVGDVVRLVLTAVVLPAGGSSVDMHANACQLAHTYDELNVFARTPLAVYPRGGGRRWAAVTFILPSSASLCASALLEIAGVCERLLHVRLIDCYFVSGLAAPRMEVQLVLFDQEDDRGFEKSPDTSSDDDGGDDSATDSDEIGTNTCDD